MFKAKTFSLAEAYAVYNGRVIKLIAEKRVSFLQNSFKQAGVGIKARSIQNSVFCSEKLRDFFFKIFVYRRSTTNKPHACHSISVLFNACDCGFFKFFARGEAKIIV